ncbi:hypothetical protein FACS1894216_01330 [Synergistales bacterium]|nr:hypothetical protein FACS1894216_01330 [Synergistales bacterium]
MNDITERNYRWFKDNLQRLADDYSDKYLAIKNQRVIGVYDTYPEAFNDTQAKEPADDYIIQLCSTDKEKTLNMFHSRVSFH